MQNRFPACLSNWICDGSFLPDTLEGWEKNRKKKLWDLPLWTNFYECFCRKDWEQGWVCVSCTSWILDRFMPQYEKKLVLNTTTLVYLTSHSFIYKGPSSLRVKCIQEFQLCWCLKWCVAECVSIGLLLWLPVAFGRRQMDFRSENLFLATFLVIM